MLAVVFVPLLVSGCSAEYWTPYASETPPAVSESDADAGPSAEATELPTPQSLDAGISTLPGLWNEAILPGGAQLPDPIPADDSFEGVSTASLFLGDLTVFIQWADDTGEISLLEIEGPVDAGGLADSELALTAPGMAHAVMGLDVADAQKFIAEAIDTSVSNAADPTFISEAIEENGTLLSINASDGLARLTVESIPEF